MPESTASSDSARRRKLGELAIEKGLLTEAQLKEALHAQTEMKKLGLSEQLGTILFKKKYLSKTLVADLLKEQAQALSMRRLGNFEIKEKIGAGAMGVVFKARQVSMDRIVALKILSPKYSGDATFIERFVREARAAGQFSHENIVSALDVGFAEPYHYFAMEYVEGETLRTILKKKGKLDEQEALRVTLGVAKGLDHALEKNIIHRDVKPDNIIMSKKGTVKLLDLGLACAVGAESEEADGEKAGKTEKPKRALGTPLYISPEAACGKDDLDTRADIYSLGCTLFHFLAGKAPFEGGSREVMERHVAEDIPGILFVNPEISDHTARIVGKMTARDRDARYATPQDLIADLEAVIAGKTPRLGAKDPSNKTTGPRAPIAGKGTTGPRSPVKAGSTTGPRAPVRAGSTTGPRTAIQVKIGTGPSQAVGAPHEQAPATGPSKGLMIGIGVAALALVGLGAFFAMSGGATPPSESKSASPTPPTAAPSRETPKTPVKNTPSPAQPTPDVPKGPTREELAKQALEELQLAGKQSPDDYLRLLNMGDQALGKFGGTESGPALTELHKTNKEHWEKLVDGTIKLTQDMATDLARKGNYAQAVALYRDDLIPNALRYGDWKARLDASKKAVEDVVEGAAAKLVAEAREKAKPGTAEALKAAIVIADQASALPAPSAAKAKADKTAWEAKLTDVADAAEKARLEKLKKGQEQLASVRGELEALLKQNRLAQAVDLLDKKLDDNAFAAAKDNLTQEKADIAGVLEMRRKAIEAIKRKPGETVTLKQPRDSVTGAVQAGGAENSVVLKVAGGPEMSFTAEALDFHDVEKYAPKDVFEPVETMKRLGLLFLYAGDAQGAKLYFTTAKEKGLADAAKPYLERAEFLLAGEAEGSALKAWNAAEQLNDAKSYKEAQAAYEAFQQNFGASKVFAQHADDLKSRLAAIKDILNPLKAGVAALYFKDDLRDQNLVYARVETKIDFDWKNGSPEKRVPKDNFGGRYLGTLKTDKAGSYTFTINGGNQAKLLIDDKPVIDAWKDPKANKATVDLEAGQHDFKLEFFHKNGGAAVRLNWSLKDGFKDQPVAPADFLYDPTQDLSAKFMPAPPVGQAVFLSDFDEQDVRVNTWNFGKKGQLGNNNQKITVKGKDAANGLSTHPPANGDAHVTYYLNKQFKTLTGEAAICDATKGSATGLKFKILGDDKLLWESKALKTKDEVEAIQVNVTGVNKLELIVSCPGGNQGAAAVWIDPQVSK